MLFKAIIATAIAATSAVAAPLEARQRTSSSYFSPLDTWQYSVHNGAIAATPSLIEIYKSTSNGGKDQSALVTFTYPITSKGKQYQLEFHLPTNANPTGRKKIQVFSSIKPAPGPTSS